MLRESTPDCMKQKKMHHTITTRVSEMESNCCVFLLSIRNNNPHADCHDYRIVIWVVYDFLTIISFTDKRDARDPKRRKNNSLNELVHPH